MESIPGESQRAWSMFPNSPMQANLHNELVKVIEADRNRLETCGTEEFLGIQQRVKAYRSILGILHRKDKNKTPV